GSFVQPLAWLVAPHREPGVLVFQRRALDRARPPPPLVVPLLSSARQSPPLPRDVPAVPARCYPASPRAGQAPRAMQWSEQPGDGVPAFGSDTTRKAAAPRPLLLAKIFAHLPPTRSPFRSGGCGPSRGPS